MAEKYDIGIAGLGVMGQSLALNLERNGYSVAGYDTDGSKKDELKKRFKSKNYIADSLPDLISAIEIPRKLMMLVPAGKPVDALIHDLKPLLSENDVVIDGGNSFFEDTERRCEAFKGSGVNFIGAGISGGEEGALKGPCIMMGGSEEAYRLLEKIFTKISAHVGEEPCCDHVGTGGAGHFVKMVHNAIEYGDMQVICEAYYVLTQIFGLQASEVKSIFESWNEGELGSYLMEISSEILGIADQSTNKPLIDVILDSAEQKGTGKWSIQTALDLGVAVPTLSAAVDARMVSSQKKDRTVLSTILNGPPCTIDVDNDVFVENLKKATVLSKLLCYAQGLSLLKKASEVYDYNFNYYRILRIWRGGCIIRAKILDTLSTAFQKSGGLKSLLFDPDMAEKVNNNIAGLRYVVSKAAESGIPVPAFSASLHYYDSYRTARLPANLLQAQRDYFGAHTYKRTDKAGTFHTDWKHRDPSVSS